MTSGFSSVLRRLLSVLFLASAFLANARGDLIQQADALDARNENAAALEIYLAVFKEQGESAELLRRIAKQQSQLISDASSREQKHRLARESVRNAERAVELDPKSGVARLALAICLGRLANLESPRARIELAKRVRTEAEYAARLDPSQDYAWHVLGRWHYEMATLNPALRLIAESLFGKLPEASLVRAAEYFEKAIASGPPRVVHHVELGRTLIALGRVEEGRREIQTGLALPSREKEDNETKARGRAALRGLGT
jgi:tetratricopeptide (TPR) repeat protein